MRLIAFRKEIEKKLFWIGIFLMPSAFGISVIFLLISLLISLKNNFKEIISDKINLTFILFILVLHLITLIQSNEIKIIDPLWDKSLSWIGLTNWIPLFLIFLGFQYLLDSKEDRLIAGNCFLAGTFPVLISGIGQYFFNWHGPFEFFNGLIVWYQRPVLGNAGLSALFNNQNYAGSWFCIVLPFCLAAFIRKTEFTLSKFVSLFLLIIITTCLMLTTSRSAWGGLILLIPLMIGFASIPADSNYYNIGFIYLVKNF